MLQVQHLVVDDIFHRTTGNPGMIKNTAHHDRVMRGVVVSQVIAGMPLAPCHPWTRQETVKEARVQVLKNTFEVVHLALGGVDALATAELPHEMGFVDQVMAGDVLPIAGAMGALNWLPVHLGQQDMGDGT